MKTEHQNQDPLYTIFEQHLFEYQDGNSDREEWILGIVKDYLGQLRRMGLSVPQEWELQVIEELSVQVQTMLLKKLYGCLTINEFIKKTPASAKKKAARNYRELKKKAG